MMQKLNGLLFLICLLALVSPAGGQQLGNISKIGFLGVRPDESRTTFNSFKQQLYALGYSEGKDIAFEYRNAENKYDRLPALVDELVRLKVDVFVVASTNEARAAKKATMTIPIVGLSLGDPVATGLVGSFARPGANLTGFTTINSELGGKRLELLKETVPKLSRVAVLWDPKGSGRYWEEVQAPAKALGLQLRSLRVNVIEQFDKAFEEAIRARSGAVVVTLSPLINSNQRRIHELLAKNRLPAIYSRAEFVNSGGLMSYGADRSEGFKRVAVMVDKILKGTKPADIPIERPTKFEFVINLKTAKMLNLTIPQTVLFRADKVIR